MKILCDAAFDCYRAHHAFSRFSNSNGKKTGVLFGFLRAINSYRKRFAGEVIVAWEGRPVSRHTESATYKADRDGLPSDVVAQLAPLRDILRSMGVLQVQHPDWEADDILATMATRIKASGESVVIVTGDDDLLQMVTDTQPPIMAFNPRTKVMHHEAQVVEKYGVGPKDLAVLWAIQGDASDNIPGVKGVGARVSVELAARFGADLLNQLETVTPFTPGDAKKLAEVIAHKDVIRSNLALLKLNDNVQDMVMDEPLRNPEKLEAIFREYQLGSFLKSFSEWSGFNG